MAEITIPNPSTSATFKRKGANSLARRHKAEACKDFEATLSFGIAKQHSPGARVWEGVSSGAARIGIAYDPTKLTLLHIELHLYLLVLEDGIEARRNPPYRLHGRPEGDVEVAGLFGNTQVGNTYLGPHLGVQTA